ncbi:MAG: GIY-YIG nuclease family protein [Ghiorsea sp.]
MKNAKTIQIFLPDGNPRGVRIAEITSRTVQVCLIPRAGLELALKRDELAAPGLYLLFGSNEDDGKLTAYIGEAENFAKRIKNPDHQKREWTHAMVATSKTGFLTKTHVKYLESISIDEATKANRYRLGNGQSSARPHVRESDEADIWDFFETMRLLVSTLGYPIFDEMIKANIKKKDLLHCKGKDADATGEYTEDGLVVLTGSTCNLEVTNRAEVGITKRREKLLEEGVLKVDGNVLIFKENYVFPLPSAAACAVLGRNANGWREWKYGDGKTLNEDVRQ